LAGISCNQLVPVVPSRPNELVKIIVRSSVFITPARIKPKLTAMRSLRSHCCALLMMGTTSFAVPAFAQYYGGVVLNQSATTSATFGIGGGDKPSDIATLSQMTRGLVLSNDPSLGIKLGYRFSPFFSLEAKYADKTGLAADVLRVDTSSAGFRNQNFGVGAVDVHSAALANAGARSVNGALLGLGMQYNFNRSVGLRFEVERNRRFFSDRSSQDVDNISFGVHWRF
jgi:hypothetical protein